MEVHLYCLKNGEANYPFYNWVWNIIHYLNLLKETHLFSHQTNSQKRRSIKILLIQYIAYKDGQH